jgi:hypothetical protein
MPTSFNLAEKKPRIAGFFTKSGSLALWLSYNVFDTFNFDLYATIWCQAIDLCFGSTASFVATGVTSD